MTLAIDADDAWWPPTFTPLGVFRTRLAWCTMLVASQSTRRWTASRTSISVSRAGAVVLIVAGILPGAALPARCEEVGQQRGGLPRQDAAGDLGPVVEPRLGEDVEDTARRARLRIGAAVDDAGHAREDDRAGAHGARLERHVERAVEHAPRADRGRRLAERDRLGVRGRVLAQLALVSPGADDLAVADDDRADRHVVVVERAPGLGDGQAHPVLVVEGRHHRHDAPRRRILEAARGNFTFGALFADWGIEPPLSLACSPGPLSASSPACSRSRSLACARARPPPRPPPHRHRGSSCASRRAPRRASAPGPRASRAPRRPGTSSAPPGPSARTGASTRRSTASRGARPSSPPPRSTARASRRSRRTTPASRPPVGRRAAG